MIATAFPASGEVRSGVNLNRLMLLVHVPAGNQVTVYVETENNNAAPIYFNESWFDGTDQNFQPYTLILNFREHPGLVAANIIVNGNAGGTVTLMETFLDSQLLPRVAEEYRHV